MPHDNPDVEAFLKENQKKGGNETKRKYGKEFYQEMGRKGGKAAAKLRTKQQYSDMGKRSAAKRKEQE